MNDMTGEDKFDLPVVQDDDLIKFLNHSDHSVQRWALDRILETSGDPNKKKEALLAGLQSQHHGIVLYTLNCIGEHEEEFPVEPLHKCSKRGDLNKRERMPAVGLMAGMGDKEAQEEVLEAIETCDDEAYALRYWHMLDSEGFIEAVRARWGGSSLPPSYLLLDALIENSAADLLSAVFLAAEKLEDEFVEELIFLTFETNNGFWIDLPEPEDMEEVWLGFMSDFEDNPLSFNPGLQAVLDEQSEKLQSAARDEKWEAVLEIILDTIDSIGEFAGRIKEEERFSWGMNVAHTFRERRPKIGDDSFIARLFYPLCIDMLVLVYIEHKMENADWSEFIADLKGIGEGNRLYRLPDFVNLRWEKEKQEGIDSAIETIDEWLDVEDKEEYMDRLWAANSLRGYPVNARMENVIRQALDNTLEERELRIVIDLIGDYLMANPDYLRENVQELLHQEPKLRGRVLGAIGKQNKKWASDAVLNVVDRLLEEGCHEELWQCLIELGDPAALDVAIKEWRSGESLIAMCAVHLAHLNGSVDSLPEEMKAQTIDHERYSHGLQSTFFNAGSDAQADEEFKKRFSDAPLYLSARCTQCGRTYTYQVPCVMVDLESTDHRSSIALDRVMPNRVIICKNCGAKDRYEFTPKAANAIHLAMMSSMGLKQDAEERKVVLAIPQLWDGTRVNTPTQAMDYLRNYAEKNPDNAAAWRRLGNACQRYGELQQAAEAWEKAVEVDPAEAEAAYSLMSHYIDANDVQRAFNYLLLAIGRLPEADINPEDRRTMAENLIDNLEYAAGRLGAPLALNAVRQRSVVDGQVLMDIGKVNLQRVEKWDRLKELLANNELISICFDNDVPDPEMEPTALEMFINREPNEHGFDPVGFAAVQEYSAAEKIIQDGPKIGRNDPCPCGSGRKHKKCCGARR